MRRSRRASATSDVPAAPPLVPLRRLSLAGASCSDLLPGDRQGRLLLFTGDGGDETVGGSLARLGTLDSRVPVPARASSFSAWSNRDSSDATCVCRVRLVSRCVRMVVRSCSFSAWHVVSCEL